jgi:hypothetical protein
MTGKLSWRLRWLGAQARLARLTGDPDADVSSDPPLLTVERERLRGGIGATPRLTALDADVAAAEAETDLARAAKRPDWRVSTSYGRRDPAYGDMVSVGVSIDLPLFSRKRQDPLIAAREAEADRARFSRTSGERDLNAGSRPILPITTCIAGNSTTPGLHSCRSPSGGPSWMASYAAASLGSALLSSPLLPKLKSMHSPAKLMSRATRSGSYTYMEVRP